MGLDFKIRDFAYPLSILKLKKRFDKNQWLSEEELLSYQMARLKLMIEHCYRHVPYYQELFRKHNIIPSDIRAPGDLKIVPYLNKDVLMRQGHSLVATNAGSYRPRWVTTSGNTGGQVRLCMGKSANVLEFVYYWRLWGWAGYRIGDTFAELSAQYFTPYEKKSSLLCHFEPVTRRLLVNSLRMARNNLEDYCRIFNKYRPLFLKGLPSNLYMLALLFSEKKGQQFSFKAIFSQGENLLNYQRAMIERVFSCKIYDSYGQMERAIAISQCPQGSYHVNSDYGLAEFIGLESEREKGAPDSEFMAEIVGTSLYNFSMPLIRYKTQDLAKMRSLPKKCPCGRSFPTVISIVGRGSDVVITPDGRAVTALYVAFDRMPNIIFGQILQEKICQIDVRVAYAPGANAELSNNLLLKNIRDFVGNSIDIRLINLDSKEIDVIRSEKFRVIVSNIHPENILS